MQDEFGKWLVRLALGAILFVGIRYALLYQVTNSLTAMNTAAQQSIVATQQNLAAASAKLQADAAKKAALLDEEKRLKLESDVARQRAIAAQM